MTLSVLNDTHVGAIRSGGTTPQTAFALRQYLKDRLKVLMGACNGTDILFNGDLFDTGNIPFMDLWDTVEIFSTWLQENPKNVIYAAGGNHDYNKNAMQMSSFQLFCLIMQSRFTERFVAIHEPTLVEKHGAYVIPHMLNQDLFDLALSKVPKVKYLFLHCNFDNKFAQQADHSLNLSPDQARELPVERIILGHEHQRSVALTGKVMVPGNQSPSSVADCLGNRDKYMAVARPDKVELIAVWSRDPAYAEIPWAEALQTGLDERYQFIRVIGEATSAEAAKVASTIAKLRSTNKTAFVVTNAVKVEGQSAGEEYNLEAVKSFDITEAVLRRLNEPQRAVVNKLLKDANVQAT